MPVPVDLYARAKVMLEALLHNVASQDPARATDAGSTAPAAKKQRVERVGGCYGAGTLELPAIFKTPMQHPVPLQLLSILLRPGPIRW